MDHKPPAQGFNPQRSYTPDTDDELELAPPTTRPSLSDPSPTPIYQPAPSYPQIPGNQQMPGMQQIPGMQQMSSGQQISVNKQMPGNPGMSGNPQIPGNQQMPNIQQTPMNEQMPGNPQNLGYQQAPGNSPMSGHQQFPGNPQIPGNPQNPNFHQIPSYHLQIPAYQQMPGYQQMPSYQQIPGSQLMPGYQQIPFYQQMPGYQQIPGFQQFSGYQQIPGYQYANQNHQAPAQHQGYTSVPPHSQTSAPSMAGGQPPSNVPFPYIAQQAVPVFPPRDYPSIDPRHLTPIHSPDNSSVPPRFPNTRTPDTGRKESHPNIQSPNTGVPATPPMTDVSPSPYPPPSSAPASSTIPPKPTSSPEMIIALMGVTGAGKSYFIREVTGSSRVIVGSGLNSCTSEVQSFSFEYEGAKITLVDTPGFDDTKKSDTEVLKDICDWTSETYKKEQLLSGIIYLHRITDIRMGGSALKNLKMFQKLCGQGALGNVFLTTTQWSKVDPKEGNLRETELQSRDFWGRLLEKGAGLRRFQGNRESGLELIRELMSKIPKPLDIQEQIVDQNKTLIETDAGQSINEELIAQEKKYKEELESLERERQEAIRAKDDEMREMVAEEQAKAQEKLAKAAAEREMLAKLHEEEMRKREAEERKRHEDMRKRVIAVASNDVRKPVHVQNIFAGCTTYGRFIVDTNDDEEFNSEPFRVTIEYDRNIFTTATIAASKTMLQMVSDTRGMTNHNFIDFDGARYWYKHNGLVRTGNQTFVIFQRKRK